MSGVIHVNSLKTAREALCLAEGAVRHIHGQTPRAELIAAMIRDIDEQRPLGPDGKHGNRHTPTCGCEPVPLDETDRRNRWDRDREPLMPCVSGKWHYFDPPECPSSAGVQDVWAWLHSRADDIKRGES